MAVDITPRLPAGRQLIESYGAGGFKVSGSRYAGSILVVPDRVILWDAPVAEAITAPMVTEALAAVRSEVPAVSILVVGCGPAFIPAPLPLIPSLRAAGIAVEWMATGAACRTYNVLMLEGRSVAAALIAID